MDQRQMHQGLDVSPSLKQVLRDLISNSNFEGSLNNTHSEQMTVQKPLRSGSTYSKALEDSQ